MAVVAFLAFLLAGCGASGGGSDAAGSTTSVTAGSGDEPTTTGAVQTTTLETDESTTPGESTTTAGGGEVCSALEVIKGYEAETRGSATAPWSELQPILIDGTPAVIAAYDDAIAAAEPDLAADLKTLRDFTAPTADLAKESSSVEELGGKLAALPGLVESGQAGQRLDTFSRANCGFGTSEAGGPLDG